MNAEKFFEKYSIEEISEKTKISPISLRFIRNKEFDKIPKAKFFGFINIIEKEYNVDLSDLKEEYNQLAPKKEEETPEIVVEKQDKRNYFIFILAFLLLIIGGFVLYTTLNKHHISDEETNTSVLIKIPSKTKEQNNSQMTNISYENNISLENNNSDNNITFEKNSSKDSNNSNKIVAPENKKTVIKPKTVPVVQKYNLLSNSKKTKQTVTKQKKYEVDIIPKKLVWFKVINIDTNKTTQFLTSKEKILPKGNYYIKFGHGEITIHYDNQTINPNTKKIVRILFKDGNYTFMQKPNRFEK